MKYSLRSLMTFSIRDLFGLTVVVALVVAWWLDRSRSHEELRNVQFRLSLAEESNELLRSIAKSKADRAELSAAYEKDLKAAREADMRDMSYRVDAGNLLGPPLPNSQAPTPNPPKK